MASDETVRAGRRDICFQWQCFAPATHWLQTIYSNGARSNPTGYCDQHTAHHRAGPLTVRDVPRPLDVQNPHTLY